MPFHRYFGVRLFGWIVAIDFVSVSPTWAQIALPSSNEVESYLRSNPTQLDDPGGGFDGDPFHVRSLEPSALGGFLKRHRLFEACVWGYGLETAILPAGGSGGLFATDGKHLRYLNRTNQRNFEGVLRQEQLALERVDAKAIADLFVETLLQTDNRFHTDIVSAYDVLAMEKLGRGYVIDDAERPKYESRVKAPIISGTKTTGWRLEFYTLAGWMHKTTTVTRQLFEISWTYAIDRHEEVLTSATFSDLPRILY